MSGKEHHRSKGPRSTGALRALPVRSVGTSGKRLPRSSQGAVAVGAKAAGSRPSVVGKEANQVGSKLVNRCSVAFGVYAAELSFEPKYPEIQALCSKVLACTVVLSVARS